MINWFCTCGLNEKYKCSTCNECYICKHKLIYEKLENLYYWICNKNKHKKPAYMEE